MSRIRDNVPKIGTTKGSVVEKHNNLVTRIAHLEQNLSRIEDQFDTLKMEKDTALVVADNKLVEQTDNTDTLKHLKNTQDRQGELQQAFIETLKTILTSFIDLQHCKSFQHFSRKLTWEYDNFLETQLFKINSFLSDPISK